MVQKGHRINEYKGGRKRGREPGHPPRFFPFPELTDSFLSPFSAQ